MDLSVALLSIARPTFDLPLAQSVADGANALLTDAGFEVVGTGAELLMDADAASQAIFALASAEFDLLVIFQASFADSTMAVEIAASVGSRHVPVLLWAVPDERDGGRLRLNSLCGINLAGHALTRRGIAYDYLHMAADDRLALAQIERLARVGRAIHTLQGARIGLMGEHPDGFDTCDYNAQDLDTLFGTEVVPFALDSLLKDAAGIPSEARQVVVERAALLADNLSEMDADGVNGTAGVYVALRKAADQHGLDGVAVRCWPEFFTELGCAACGAMSMLNDERCPASCEADVNGTVTSLLLQSISGGLAFITDLVSIDGESDTGVFWHCGLAPAGMADPQAEILATVHSNRQLPLLFEFPLKPGRVTLARLHRTAAQGVAGADAYRLVIGGGEMQRANKSFTGTSGVIRFDVSATNVLDTVMGAGLEHHFNITYGDYRQELRDFARLVGLDVLELTPRHIEDEQNSKGFVGAVCNPCASS